MKKITILFAAAALLATTACNEKFEKPAANGNDSTVKTEQQAAPKDSAAKSPKINVERPKPTSDGKDKVVGEFTDANGYQVKLVNNADGAIHLSVWKPGQDKSSLPQYNVVTKNCVMGKDNYMMKGEDGKSYVVNLTSDGGEIFIMSNNTILYSSKQK